MLPNTNTRRDAVFAGRVWRPGIGPSLVTLRDETGGEVTCRDIPTMRELIEQDSPSDWLRHAEGEPIASLAALVASSTETAGADALRFLAPTDLQAVKASGVTFAESMVERVIEEQAAGDADRAHDIRLKVQGVIGESLVAVP